MISQVRKEKIEEILCRKQPDLQLFCDNVHSSQNISAILRSCDGAGVLHVAYSVNDDQSLRIHKTITQGAHRWVERERIDTAKKAAFLARKRQEGFAIVTTHLDPDAISFREVDYTKPTVIVMGNEKEGISDEVLEQATHRVHIPMMGMVQSLNVSVASALLLYEAQRQREEAGMYAFSRLDQKMRDYYKESWIRRDMIVRRSKGWIMA